MTTQVELIETEIAALQELAHQTGKTQQELLHEAVKQLIDDSDQVDWRAALSRLEGISENRHDLPDLRELRREWDREPWLK